MVGILKGQNSSFLPPWSWSSENHYILNKDVVNSNSNPSVDLFSQPANGALYYDNGDLVTFIPDPFWNRIVYAEYNSNWAKAYGQYGSGNAEFKHPNAVTTDGYGCLFIADTHNGRITSEFFGAGSEITSFYSRGVNIFDQPVDLDYDSLAQPVLIISSVFEYSLDYWTFNNSSKLSKLTQEYDEDKVHADILGAITTLADVSPYCWAMGALSFECFFVLGFAGAVLSSWNAS